MSTIAHMNYSVQPVEFKPINSPDGPLHPIQFDWEDGHTSYSFVPEDLASPGLDARYNSSNPRIIARNNLFLGMFAPEAMRGQGTGNELLSWFCDYGEDVGNPITNTGIIRKPLISLLLRQQGFIPQTLHATAEILPAGRRSASGIPKIRWVRNTLNPEQAVDTSPSGEPYYVVSQPNKRFAPNNEAKLVALHTKYLR